MDDNFRGKPYDDFYLANPFALSSEINKDEEYISPSDDVDDCEIPVSVLVERTTFTAVYGIVNGYLELVSPDFGEGRVPVEGRPAQQAAEELLRIMAIEEISRTEVPFMADYEYDGRTLATNIILGAARPSTTYDVAMTTCRVPWMDYSRLGLPMTEASDDN